MVVRGEEESFHMTTSVTYVTEEHFSFVEGALTYLALGILGGRAGGWGGMTVMRARVREKLRLAV